MDFFLSLLKVVASLINLSFEWELRQAVWAVINMIIQFPIFHKAQGFSVGALLLIFL